MIASNEVQPSNTLASLSIWVKPSKVMLVKLLHSLKALSPMLVTELGMVMLDKSLHLLNAS